MLRNVMLQSTKFVREQTSDEFEDAFFDVIQPKIVLRFARSRRFDVGLPEPRKPLKDGNSIVGLGSVFPHGDFVVAKQHPVAER